LGKALGPAAVELEVVRLVVVVGLLQLIREVPPAVGLDVV
jgi:hypothetical protein